MMLFHAILTLTTMKSAYLHRFTEYTSMFLMIYYPSVFRAISSKFKSFIIIVALFLYFLYFRYELTNGVDNVVWQWSFSHFGEY